MAKYCPQCQSLCDVEACPTNERGRCRRCGKPPVAETDTDRARSWLWCTEHDQWHQEPCAQDSARHCCASPAAA